MLPGEPRWIAAVGTVTTFCRVFTRSRALTNWFGNKALSALSNCARTFTVPVVVSIWLSTAETLPMASCLTLARSKAVTCSVVAGVQLRHDFRQIVLGNREDHRDRLHLGDHGNAARAGGLHVISRIDQAQADAAGDRRNDVAIGDVQRLRIDLRLVELHRALVLLHDEDLILGLLARYRILLRPGSDSA